MDVPVLAGKQDGSDNDADHKRRGESDASETWGCRINSPQLLVQESLVAPVHREALDMLLPRSSLAQCV